jgi:GTPase involved in cell partitioning and DNA repair
MAAAVVDQCMGVVTNLECTKVNGSSPCLCCEKLKVELQKVISELKSELKYVVEIAKVLKEDQEQLSRKVDGIECSSVNMLNTVSKAGSNAVCLTGRKTVSQHKRQAKIDTDPHQQFKIPKVVNRFAALDNLLRLRAI